MKFVTSLVLLAATSVVANSRELEGTTARMLQIFDGFLGGFGMDLSLECDTSVCTDEAVCDSFLMDMSAGALERQCNAGERQRFPFLSLAKSPPHAYIAWPILPISQHQPVFQTWP